MIDGSINRPDGSLALSAVSWCESRSGRTLFLLHHSVFSIDVLVKTDGIQDKRQY